MTIYNTTTPAEVDDYANFGVADSDIRDLLEVARDLAGGLGLAYKAEFDLVKYNIAENRNLGDWWLTIEEVDVDELLYDEKEPVPTGKFFSLDFVNKHDQDQHLNVIASIPITYANQRPSARSGEVSIRTNTTPTLDWLKNNDADLYGNDAPPRWQAVAKGNRFFRIHKRDGEFVLKRMRMHPDGTPEVLNNNGRGFTFPTLKAAQDAAEKAEKFAQDD